MRLVAEVTAICTTIAGFCTTLVCAAAAEPSSHQVGLAKINITPGYSIRLSGFAGRQTESVGVREQIFARAMAIRGSAGKEPVVLVAVESIGVPMYIRDEVASRLQTKKQLPNERFTVCSTHTHTAPVIDKVLPTLFGAPVPPDQQQRVEQYTHELTDKIEEAALAALADMRPARLAYGIGKVGFAINRRTRGGPVDHDLPVMSITDANGKIRGVWLNCACHCVVLSDFKISGDWAGYASKELERLLPESIALISIGCGADSNPQSGVTGDKAGVAEQYGQEVAAEVDRLLRSQLTPIHDDIRCRFDKLRLPLQSIPTREQWAERAKQPSFPGYYAKVMLECLDAGEKLPTEIPLAVQTWKFGSTLATVFLSGEVVVDYSLRLKKEFDPKRLWVNAYSNDVPSYIPSERVLKEGGYEGGGAMVYYGWPAPFAPGLENEIIATVRTQLGDEFKLADQDGSALIEKLRGTQGVFPKSPAESLAAIKVHDGLRVELVASEPMIADPVAIDFGADGKVWVVETRDYGCQEGEPCPPKGRVTVLEDRDRDGTFETSSVFLDKIAQPMGITVWRKGVLISAAPDLLYAEDTNGDGKADDVRTLFTGFSTENEQSRLNQLNIGLDGWLYGGCLFVGDIRNAAGRAVAIGNRDFRINPDRAEIQAESGQVQHPRVRDDWGNWFGTENTQLCNHMPISDQYLRRNPHVIPPPLEVRVPSPAAAKLYSPGKLVMFPLSGPPGIATAACGSTFYRDELLGRQFSGEWFTCEPVHQMVHRLKLEATGSTFRGDRPEDESQSEFLASTDNWFRPVQARTGPDGALWIVDMYRYVIEHARWIPKEILDKLDVYAGNGMGRIYRVLPENTPHKPLPRFDKLSTLELAAAMDSANGTQRDMIQQLLVWRGDGAAGEPLGRIVNDSPRPPARFQSLCTLELLGKLTDEQIEKALHDSHPAVRRQAVRLAEPRFRSSPKLLSAALQLVDDRDAFVALQLACSLGESEDPRILPALAALVERHATDVYVTTGIMTSVNDAELSAFLPLALSKANKLPPVLVNRLLEWAGTSPNPDALRIALADVEERIAKGVRNAFFGLEALLAGVSRNSFKSEVLSGEVVARFHLLAQKCATVADDPKVNVATRAACIRVIGRTPQRSESDIESLGRFLNAAHDPQLQTAAVNALAEQSRPRVADILLQAWPTFTPALRARVLDMLLTRKQWVAAFLSACEAQAISPSEINAIHRDRLTSYPDADLRKRAAATFSQGSSAERLAAVARYLPQLKKGDFDRGKAVFDKSCSVCHRVHNLGNTVGPDIAARQDKSNEGLLREILDPNRTVDQRYANYVATTIDGIVKNGILAGETSVAITLRGQQNEEVKLLRSELESLTSTGKSLMPEGFENQITPAEMSDLITFLAVP